MRRFVPAWLLIALAVGLAACSGGGAATGGDSGGSGAATTPVGTGAAGATPGAASSGAVTGHVGDKLTFYGGLSDQAVDVTLVKIFDPATPTDASTAALPSGARWVGVETTIDNHSSQAGNELLTLDGTASDGTKLTTLDDYQGFSRPIGAFQGCTPTSPTDESGVPFTSCDAFVVTDGQTLVQVGFNVAQLGQTDQATWTLP